MEIGKLGIELIQHYESCRLTSYWDNFGKCFSIGWGSTNGVTENETITQDEANQMFLDDIKLFENMLNDRLDITLEQYQFDALLSFLYNIGPGEKGVKDGLFCLENGEPSTLWKMVQSSDFSDATKQFLLWTHSGGVVLNGLVKRRKSESILFSTGKLDFDE